MATIVTRTDEDIRLEVQDELEWDLQVGSSPVGVAVKGGVATLTGEVPSYAAKLAAADATHRVRGVKAVANDIIVHIPSFAERTDADIAQAIITALRWNTLVPTDQIDVTVTQGLVTLKGTVEWAYQRNAAEYAIRHLAGVRVVTNEIRLTPHVQREDLKHRLERALERNAEVEASGITVEVHGATVTLKGKVRSYAERRAAEYATWDAPGVTVVDNRLIVNNI